MSYSVCVDSSSGTTILEARIVVNGTEVPGSAAATTLGASDQKTLSLTVCPTLSLNDVVKFQFYASTANGRLIYPGAGATAKVTAIINLLQVVE